MSLAQHKNIKLRFEQQVVNSATYVIPFIEEALSLHPGMKVMEVGCGEGGVLKPFLKRGCYCVGVELLEQKKRSAEEFLNEFIQEGTLQLINQNIYDLDFLGEFKSSFDLIILKDAIEHIPDQERIMGYLKKLLKPEGMIYLGFPPWYMPHGGHQQICQNKTLSWLPYFHILPKPIYRSILKSGKESPGTIQSLMEIKDTGISIERFTKIIKKTNYSVVRKQFYLINPIYSFKFGWKPRKQSRFISGIPFVRNFLTTCVYYLIKADDDR